MNRIILQQILAAVPGHQDSNHLYENQFLLQENQVPTM